MPELSDLHAPLKEEQLLKMSREGSLTHQGRALSVDLWTVWHPVILLGPEVARMQLREDRTAVVNPRYVDEADWCEEGWVLFGRVLYRLPEDAEGWRVPQACSEGAIAQWKREWPVEGEWVEQTTPHLVLRDKTGRFVQLMERGASLRPASPQSPWARDLLEAGYQRAISGEYVSPPDRAFEALQLLLECGWTAELRNQGPVQLLTKREIALGSNGHLSGALHFGTSEVPLERCAKQAEGLVALPIGWGLLPPDPFWKELVMDGEGVRLKRSAAGRVSLEGIELSASGTEWMGMEWPEQPDPSFKGTLRPYQEVGRSWILGHYSRAGGGILADEMGLGKTVQVLAALSHLPTPVLIVVPTSLIPNWSREIQRFLPEAHLIVHHGVARTEPAPAELAQTIVLTSYGLVRTDPWIRRISWEAVICDEAHLLKNADAQTTQAVHQLKGRLRLAVTGTPLENHPEELRTQLSFLEPDALLDRARWEAAFTTGLGRQALRKHLEPLLLRRRKVHVATDLPPLLEQLVWLEMSAEQKGWHEELRQEARLHGLPILQILERLMRMRQLCCTPQLLGLPGAGPKLEQLWVDLEELRAEGASVVVFSQFASFLERARDHVQGIGSIELLTGASKDRGAIVDRFQSGETPILMATLKAGGVGLNLQRADVVILLEPWWNRAAEQQAIDRAHRIGREGKVLVRRYLMADSIEERVRSLQARKLEWANALWEDADVPLRDLGDQDLEWLLGSD
ncbi:MAG: DEAD/DEAH box helicase [Chlamydiia bacterium]